MNILFFKKFGGNSEKERTYYNFCYGIFRQNGLAQSRQVFIFTYPVITVILSVLILHEKITVISIIGTVLILIGLVISQKN